MSYTIAYNKDNNPVCVPDKEILVDCPSYTYEPLRGYAHTLAVFNGKQECIGWCPVDSFGFKNVLEYLEVLE